MIDQKATTTEAALITMLVENCEVEVPRENIRAGCALFDIGVAGIPSLKLDSLAALELIVCVANEFGVQLDEAPKATWMTIGTLAQYIDDKRS